MVPAAGGVAVPITRAGEQRMPVWNPSGTRIVFVDQDDAFDRPELFSMLPNGTDARPLVTDQVSGGSINPAFLRRVD